MSEQNDTTFKTQIVPVTKTTGKDRSVILLSLSIFPLSVCFNPDTPDQFIPSHARDAENCGSALTHR